MQSLRCCVFIAFVAVHRCYQLSQNEAEIFCVLNGNYSDMEQVEREGGGRTPIDIRIQPVFAPALSKVPVMYFEESTGGVMLRSVILVLTGEEGDLIYVKQYNLTGNYDIKPGTFDANTIKSYTANDFRGQEDCQHSLERVEPFVLFVDWPSCSQSTLQGQRESYAASFTCNGMLVVMPVGAPEMPELAPYRNQHQGPRYPLENAPGNYVCNCDKARDTRSD